MSDLYYQPENFGLKEVAALDDSGNYDFDKLVVWQHKETGKLYFAEDSGCSCPTPFESFNNIEDATEITRLTWDQFEATVMKRGDAGPDKIELLEKVRSLLK